MGLTVSQKREAFIRFGRPKSDLQVIGLERISAKEYALILGKNLASIFNCTWVPFSSLVLA